MTLESFDIHYGAEQIHCSVVRSARRRTLGIDVFPDLSVRINAPQQTDVEILRTRVQRRARWIARKRQEFVSFGTTTRIQPVQSGANLQLLGKRYRLKIEPADATRVVISRTTVQAFAPSAWSSSRVSLFLSNWEREQAMDAFSAIAKRSHARFAEYGTPNCKLVLKAMRTRWASMSRRGTLSINPKLVRASRACIEYVITHELCHLVHPNHGPEFLRLLGRVMPDWHKRKRELEETVIL